MSLKTATTACLIAGLAMMMAWPFILNRKPAGDAPKEALKNFALLNMVYFGLLLVIFFATVVLAWLVLRKTRQEFADKSKENLQTLIQGTLQDHAKKEE